MINGQPYNVKIVAVYASGEESQPSLVSTATPGSAGAPTGLTVAGGNQKLTVSFSPPTATGGFDVTNYSYDVWPSTEANHVENWQPLSPPKTSSPAVIPGLVNGTAYKLKLRAENASGAGQVSPETQGTPRAEVPSAPTITSISAGNAALAVAFSAPTSDGGKPITSYKYSINNGVTKLTYQETSGPIDIENLTNGTKYAVILYAVNEVGVGAPSAPVEGLPSEGTTPSAPKITNVTSSVRQLSVAFTPPVKDNGYPITRYQYKLNSGRWTARNPETALTSPMILSGLANNTSYKVQIRAVNASGAGAASAIALKATPKAVPSYPKILLIDFNYSYPELGRTSANFYITFTPPDDGGSPITSYRLSVDGNVSGAIPVVDDNAFHNPQGDLSYFRAALVPPPSPQGTRIGYLRVFDSDYNMFERLFGQTWFPLVPIKLLAENALGSSEWSPIEIFTEDPEGPPLDAPTDVTITVLGSTSIRIDFTPPTRTLTQPIVGYQYSLNDGLTYSATVEAVNNTITVTDLLPGSAYDVKIKGVNNQDFAAASTTVRVITDPEAPTAPTIYTISGLDNSLVVYFSAPVTPGGVILDYEYSLDGGAYVSSGVRNSPITITGTDNDVLYTVTVRAVNQVGFGEVSNTATGLSGKPSEPIVTSVQTSAGWLGSGGELKVYFNPPLSDGGSRIIKYHYSVDNGVTYNSITVPNTNLASPITIPNLNNGQTYQIVLKAENLRSIGLPSQPVSGKPYTTPSAPTITQVIVDSSKLGTATVYFTPPISDGGSEILNYAYSVVGGYVWQTSTSAVDDNFITFTTSTSNSTVTTVVIQAVNAAGGGKTSNQVKASTITIPAPPKSVELVQVPENPTQLRLRFAPPNSNGGSVVTHYEYVLYSLRPAKYYIPAPQNNTPLPYTFLLPQTFNYGDSASLELRAINFGSDTETPVTSASGVSDYSLANIYVVPYTFTMPDNWVQPGKIQVINTQRDAPKFKQPITLKLPCNQSNSHVGTYLHLMQPIVTRVDYTFTGSWHSGSGTVFNRFNVSAGALAQRTSLEPAGTFTFTPAEIDIPELFPNFEYQITFVASNAHYTSAPFTINTQYIFNYPERYPTAPVVAPPDYGIHIIHHTYARKFSRLTYLFSGPPIETHAVSLDMYVDTKNTEVVYTLSRKDSSVPGATEQISEEITLPISSKYAPYEYSYTAVNPNSYLFADSPKPLIYSVSPGEFIPARNIIISAEEGLPFEGPIIKGGKLILTLIIVGFNLGDEVKLTLAAKNRAGVVGLSQTVVLNTEEVVKGDKTYSLEPAWVNCGGAPRFRWDPSYRDIIGSDVGYLAILYPELGGRPLSSHYYICDDLGNKRGPTYLISGGGYGRRIVSVCQGYLLMLDIYQDKATEEQLRLISNPTIICYDIEIYTPPSNLMVAWRYRGEDDIAWRWIGIITEETMASNPYYKEAFDGELNHCPYNVIFSSILNPDFPKSFLHDSMMFRNYRQGSNRSLLRMSIPAYFWDVFDDNSPDGRLTPILDGAIDPRQLEFITCTSLEIPPAGEIDLGIPGENVGPVIPYYLNLTDRYSYECYSSPPKSSGRVDLDVPKINYNCEGPCEPYAHDGYWTPTQFQRPTSAQRAAFRAKYPKYFKTASSEGGGGGGGPGGN